MKIKVNGRVSEGVVLFNLEAGRVYKDPEGLYVMACDEDYVVVLENGSLVEIAINYNDTDLFMEVEAVLEVQSE